MTGPKTQPEVHHEFSVSPEAANRTWGGERGGDLGQLLRHPGESFLHGRLWDEPRGGPPAPFHAVEAEGPAEALSDEFPLRLTTGRALDSYNTGVQTRSYASPLRRGTTVDVSEADARRHGIVDGERVRIAHTDIVKARLKGVVSFDRGKDED